MSYWFVTDEGGMKLKKEWPIIWQKVFLDSDARDLSEVNAATRARESDAIKESPDQAADS